MTSGGRRPSAFVPVPWRSVTRTTRAAAAARSAVARTRRHGLGGDERRGRSGGRGSPRRHRRSTSARASARPALSPWVRWRSVRAPRSAARGRTSRSGLIDEDVVEPIDGQGGRHGPARRPIDEVLPLLGVERPPEPRLGALERADRDDRRDRRRGHATPANSRTSRARRARPAWSRHDRVGHEGPEAEGRDLGLERGDRACRARSGRRRRE